MFKFGSNVTAFVDKRLLDNPTSPRLWKTSTFGCGNIEFKEGEELTLLIGEAEYLSLEGNEEYAINISEKGVSLVARDYNCFLRGYSVLCMKIDYVSLETEVKEFSLAEGFFRSNYKLNERMIHICVFPETDFHLIRKYIRLAGMLQYTHIVIEFWGMLKFDFLKELSWDNAYTKQQARELVDEARALGMEPVPMFNMLGHASLARNCSGKHTVLDQNPSLQYLYLHDGWTWNIKSEKVYDLLRNARKELYEIFGKSKYIHIGCDEAYMLIYSAELRAMLPEYLKRITDEIVSEGKRPMMWMDMVIPNMGEGYFGVAEKDEADSLISSINPNTVAVDWQYSANDVPLKSTSYIKEKGFKTIVAPWYEKENIETAVATAKNLGISGVMLTTWHTLKTEILSMPYCAKKMGAVTFEWSSISGDYEEFSTLVRRIDFEHQTYEQCGWKNYQIEV